MFETEIIYRYDGTFDGLLTCVFKAYERKEHPIQILSSEDHSTHLFASNVLVSTDTNLARRVMQGVVKKTSADLGRSLFQAFLTEESGIEMVILRFIQKAMRSTPSIENDNTDADVLHIRNLNKKISREVQKMQANVRFEQKEDNMYFASIAPDYNVIPLLGAHFQRRFADQKWMIYDTKRRLGIYYNLKEILEIDLLESTLPLTIESNKNQEPIQQLLWRQCFRSVNALERKNIKLNLRHVPLRYWRYLGEQQPKVHLRSHHVPGNGGKSFQVLPLS
jgi:probable DNA metabolism protein